MTGAVLLIALCALLPEREKFAYETDERGRIGRLAVTQHLDSAGYHVQYESDRTVDVLIDPVDFSTLAVRKVVNGKVELTIEKKKDFRVDYKGKVSTYREKKPIYDRHTLDYVMRHYDYTEDFSARIRLSIPEFMVVNADIAVVGEETLASPLGDIACWKVAFVPRIIFVKAEIYFWIEKDYPHRCMKYADTSGRRQVLLIEYE